MSRHQKITRLLALISLLTLPFSSIHAQNNLQIDAVVGVSMPSNSRFHDSSATGVSFTYADSALSYRAGYMYLGNFTLKDSNSDSHLETQGVYVELVKVFHTGTIDLELGGGLVAARTELFFDGESLRKQSDTSFFAEFVLAKSLNDLITLHAGVTWVNDVSGGELTVPKAGIRFSF